MMVHSVSAMFQSQIKKSSEFVMKKSLANKSFLLRDLTFIKAIITVCNTALTALEIKTY